MTARRINRYNFKKYFYSILSTALVLLIVGIYGMLLLFGQKALNNVKENLEVIVELSPKIKLAERQEIEQNLKEKKYIKTNSIRFISKEDGLVKLEKQFGDELIDLEFENPLLDIFTFHVHNPFAQLDSLKKIKLELLDNNKIQDVHYQSLIVTNLEKNTKKVSWIILIISVLLLIIAVALINNTVRLALNDNRFIIKNMQYVGATENFIIKPYIRKAMINGFLSSILAIAAICSILYLLNQQISDLFIQFFSIDLLIIFIGIILIGLIISGVSTFFAVRRFLRKSVGELY